MKQFKDINACVSQLRAIQARSDIGPEQKKNVEAAIRHLKQLTRKPDAKLIDVYHCVREVADSLISAFLK
jgi:hypothetical protein